MASSFSVPVLAIDASVMGHSLLKLFFLNEWRGCPTLSSSPAVGRGASFALAPDRRVGSVLHRRPRVPPTRGRGTFTAGSRHERAEEENGTGNECTSAAGGWRVVDRMRRRVRAPARDKCGFDGCIRVHRCRHEHLGRDDAFHRGLVGPLPPSTSTAAPLCRGKRAIEGKSPMESVRISATIPGACLVNANAQVCENPSIYPERCDGRLSSSSARHRRRVIHAPDPPRAVDVAPEPPSASSSSSHASSSSAAAQAPDGPVALLPSVVIRELGVDHRLETARRERRGQR